MIIFYTQVFKFDYSLALLTICNLYKMCTDYWAPNPSKLTECIWNWAWEFADDAITEVPETTVLVSLVCGWHLSHKTRQMSLAWILTLSMFLLYIHHISQSFVIVKTYLILQLLPWIAEIRWNPFGIGNRNFLLSEPAN